MPFPAWLNDLAPPPSTFLPCEIPDHLGANFTDHADFSSKGNKQYWLLFITDMQGMFSTKAQLLAVIGKRSDLDQIVGSCQQQGQALAAWSKHCHHRHSRCTRHRNACSAGDCPAHAVPPDLNVIRVVRRKIKLESEVVKREPQIKLESLKREASRVKAELHPPRVKASHRDPPDIRHRGLRLGRGRISPGPDDGAPPSPSPTPAPRLPAVSPAPAPRLHAVSPAPARFPMRRIEDIAAEHRRQREVQTPPTSPSASSLSTSTVTPPSGQGKGRASRSLSSVSLEREASMDDAFFVSSTGKVHHRRRDAFGEVGAGPIQVVMGWDAATDYACELVAKAQASASQAGPSSAARISRKGGERMDVD
ncbi:hypothetical protein C8R44DRAFT_873846 [Mycena epipterygia]|nr:hypothetical protein C8R44DRAFT_873846 [Mycena epipterygia]